MERSTSLEDASVRFERAEKAIHGWLIDHSVAILRISVGAVFLGFGILKFFPHVSPAQNLATETLDKLSFGLVPGAVAIVGIAALECFIGICLLLGRWMRVAIWLLVGEFVGILSPLVLLPGRLFDGPHHAPTLEGQYVIKDIVLVAAAMVIAAGTFREGRMIRHEPSTALPLGEEGEVFDTERKLEIVLAATGSGTPVEQICSVNGISEATYYGWRDAVLAGAGTALEEAVPDLSPAPTA